ncbi:hypothetical protein Tco_1394823 [Tanacetum coccineum]
MGAIRIFLAYADISIVHCVFKWDVKMLSCMNHFFKGTIDPTLFIRRFDNDILVVHVYVDDIIFGSTHPRFLQEYFRWSSILRRKSWLAGPQRNRLLLRCLSRKQNMCSLRLLCPSPLEAEQLTVYGFTSKRFQIYCDSKSAISLSCNPVQQSEQNTSLSATMIHKGETLVEMRTLNCIVKTEYPTGDLFTKAFPRSPIQHLVRRLFLTEISHISVGFLIPRSLLLKKVAQSPLQPTRFTQCTKGALIEF